MQKERLSKIIWQKFKNNKLALSGGIIIVFLILLAVFAPVISPYSPNDQNLSERLLSPGQKHLLGTDELGRDVLSRIIWGSRVSLSVGFIAIAIATFIGITLGAFAGYFGGVIDNIIMRFVDIV
ncbi:MAG: peptide ABC transporter permease, partial [Candidatus Firestonebacteria bacterium]